MSTWPERLAETSAPIDAVALALFAAASGDHNPLHLDEDVARAAGFARPIVHGMLTMAHISRLFTASFGAASLRVLETRFTGVLLRGDALRLEGTLAGMDDDGSARYALRATAASDGHEVVTGRARVAAPASAA